jgi:dUTP pyrophosphatase
MSETLRVMRLSEAAMLPTRGSVDAAGLDLYAVQECTIAPHSNALVGTGIAVEIPPGYYGRVAPRSGLSVKTSLIVNAGVIDADYRGEIKVVFNNFTDNEVKLFRGDRVAQLILERIGMFDVEDVTDLSTSERGENGFGSTG